MADLSDIFFFCKFITLLENMFHAHLNKFKTFIMCFIARNKQHFAVLFFFFFLQMNERFKTCMGKDIR